MPVQVKAIEVQANRRPIADGFRMLAKHATSLCVRTGIHPNTVSYLSLVAAGFAAISFALSTTISAMLVAGTLFCLARLYFNMLDGMVAIASGKANAVGEIANELPDRFSDVLIFIGVGYSGLCHPTLGYWAAIGSLLVAYVGTLGKASGARRDFSGPMSKPWRMVTLCAGALATLFVTQPFHTIPLSTLDWTLAVIVVGCGVTIARRIKNVVTDLGSSPTKEAN